MPFSMGVSNPPYRCIHTNARYSPEGTSHFVTVRAGTGAPEAMLKSFPPQWSAITRQHRTWGWVPTPPLVSLGWSCPRPLWKLCWTPNISVLTPGGVFFHALHPPLLFPYFFRFKNLPMVRWDDTHILTELNSREIGLTGKFSLGCNFTLAPCSDPPLFRVPYYSTCCSYLSRIDQ